MARDYRTTLRFWTDFGARSSANLELMREQRDQIAREAMQMRGAGISSASMNGATLAMREAGMSPMEFGAMLNEAIRHVENGTRPTSTSYARIF
jgi:ribonuclease PH